MHKKYNHTANIVVSVVGIPTEWTNNQKEKNRVLYSYMQAASVQNTAAICDIALIVPKVKCLFPVYITWLATI